MTNGWSHAQMLKRILRPRVMIYATVLVLLVVTLLTSLWLRSPFKVDVIRDRGVMARLAEGGMLENVYRLQIMNATESTQHYQLNATGLDQLVIQSDVLDINHTVAVNPAESRGVPVRLQIPDGSMKSGSHTVTFEIKATESDDVVTEKSIFLVPR
jgi:polyferredoxin